MPLSPAASPPAPHVHRINVNPEGGVPKHRISATRIHATGVEGDKQRDTRYHGGPEQAVCLYALERIEALRQQGHPIGPGTTGENLTLAGVGWTNLKPGDVLRVGNEAVLQVVKDCTPCKKIAGSFADGHFKRMLHKAHPGWSRLYARVLAEGTVHEGDAVMVEPAGESREAAPGQ